MQIMWRLRPDSPNTTEVEALRVAEENRPRPDVQFNLQAVSQQNWANYGYSESPRKTEGILASLYGEQSAATTFAQKRVAALRRTNMLHYFAPPAAQQTGTS